ncbi:ATP-binding cassette domain-containing protein [Desulfurispirillum indicum]|uniref:ABC transporter related protein n=1 Tax=Desulfurispirillum indicum (strain ATCC BAA-1389 / DSM 22839 / S5) TaxID=653733 RepID=E6W092_DESIS|nr:ATP-binding cassette domain-containing protein [Desulfurispirillum indicum]ADU65218.1 ABC transporter related protein [Desulfurispirillum indicum S5]UCZ57108.1 ATP-binding cassette domain-containing protein [Desulfurispirillum indicum]
MRLELSSLVMNFSDQRVLGPIDFVSPDFGCLVLVGPSGSGKTTLLRILAGLLIPSGGEVRIDGQRVARRERELLAHRRCVGMVFQEFNLFAHLSALENIALPLREVHGYHRQAADERAWHLLERFNLQEHATKKPAQLSGGQKQRIALARAIAIKPRFFLLDEPTSALDPMMTTEVLDMIAQLREAGQKIIIASHHMGFARRVGDLCAFVENGQLVEWADTSTFFNAPRTLSLQRFLETVLRY